MIEYQYIAADYFATGEGRTIMLLITRGYGQHESIKANAIETFCNRFDEYFARGINFHEKDEFLKIYDAALPQYVKDFIINDEPAGNFEFSSSCHVNYS